MVRDASGHLVEHAGFVEVGLSNAINPEMILSVGMQVMSMVSGTYYLQQINSNITKMDSKLEELLNIHHDMNVGKLIAARKGLSEIVTRQYVDLVDINAIRNYKRTADEIFEEHAFRWHRKENELFAEKDPKKEEKISDIIFLRTIAFEASKLSLYLELIEIGTRMKIGDQIEIITGLLEQLKQNYKNSFYYNFEQEFKKLHLTRQEQTSRELKDKEGKFYKSNYIISNVYTQKKYEIFLVGLSKGVFALKCYNDVQKTKKKITIEQDKFNAVKMEIMKNKTDDGIDDTIHDMIQLLYTESEILYIPSQNGILQRVFIPAE